MTKLSRILWDDVCSMVARTDDRDLQTIEIALLLEDATDTIVPSEALREAAGSPDPASFLWRAIGER